MNKKGSLFFLILCFGVVALNAQVKNTQMWQDIYGGGFIPTIKEADVFLKNFSAEVTPVVCEYDGTRPMKLTGFSNGKSNASGNEWSLNISKLVKSGKSMDMDLTFTLVSDSVNNAGVAVVFNFKNWDEDNYVLAPASMYDGNRYKIIPIAYPPYIYNKEDKLADDMPITITDVLHLNPDGEKKKVEMLTGNCTTPMMSFYDKDAKKGFIILTTQGTGFGNSGLIVEENESKNMASFIVSAPGIRENRYIGGGLAHSGDVAPELKSGDQITISLKMYNFRANDMDEYFEKVFDARKALTGENEYRNIAPFSAVTDIILAHHDKNKWYDDGKYSYICNNPTSNSPFGHAQIGWSGIPAYSYPQALKISPLRLERIDKSFDYVASTMIGKSGLMYGMSRKGEMFGDNFELMDKERSVAMTRRSGLVLYLGLQEFELFEKQGVNMSSKQKSMDMFRGIADGLVDLFNKYGEFGQFVDVETGDLDINGSTASICIAGLVQAYESFGDIKYLQTAEKAARFYVDEHLFEGYTGGGPAEILQCSDSESAAELAESLIVLYEATGNKEWLNAAQFAVHNFATWVVSYDYDYPKGSDMDRVNAKSTGSVWASVQNDHSAPGIYILSGDFLLKTYRASGDKRLMELLKDIIHNVVQHTSTDTNPIGVTSAPGYVSERVNLSDWEGKGGIGNISHGDSNMAWETVTLLSVMQNPGIYMLTDDDYMVVFDHVDAKVTKRTSDGVSLEIENKTPYDANVSIMAETKRDQSKPMGYKASLDWPRVDVKQGETINVFVNKSGEISVNEDKLIY